MSPTRLRAGDPDTVELRIAARPENLALARLALAGVGAVAGAPDDVLANLKVAVTEACTNAIQHGYDAGSGSVIVRYRAGGGVIEVEVEDEGAGFDSGRASEVAAAGPAPGSEGAAGERQGLGLGLLIIRELTDDLEIASDGNGSRISFSRQLAVD